jgi:putative tryptophan/tyrosine transport system substrate-binding protein
LGSKKRREFITLLSGAVATWPLAARAQQQMRRVGVLMNSAATETLYQSYLAAFVEALRDLGWVDGQNARIELRWAAGNADLAKASAAELVGLTPDVILAAGTANLTFLQQATASIPIVFVQVSDPVAQHFVASLTHPGGNLTGFAALEFSIGGKWVEMLKQVAPALARVAVMFNPEFTPQNEFLLRAIETDAAAFTVQIVPVRVRTDAEIEPALASFSRLPNGGLILPTNSFTLSRQSFIAEFAFRHRLPAISGNRASFAQAGGLMYYGYGASVIGQFRQAAGYVDRILKGAKPGDLPVQLPTKYDLVINLKTAKAFGLTVPLPLLVLADEVIE